MTVRCNNGAQIKIREGKSSERPAAKPKEEMFKGKRKSKSKSKSPSCNGNAYNTVDAKAIKKPVLPVVESDEDAGFEGDDERDTSRKTTSLLDEVGKGGREKESPELRKKRKEKDRAVPKRKAVARKGMRTGVAEDEE